MVERAFCARKRGNVPRLCADVIDDRRLEPWNLHEGKRVRSSYRLSPAKHLP